MLRKTDSVEHKQVFILQKLNQFVRNSKFIQYSERLGDVATIISNLALDFAINVLSQSQTIAFNWKIITQHTRASSANQFTKRAETWAMSSSWWLVSNWRRGLVVDKHKLTFSEQKRPAMCLLLTRKLIENRSDVGGRSSAAYICLWRQEATSSQPRYGFSFQEVTFKSISKPIINIMIPFEVLRQKRGGKETEKLLIECSMCRTFEREPMNEETNDR